MKKIKDNYLEESKCYHCGHLKTEHLPKIGFCDFKKMSGGDISYCSCEKFIKEPASRDYKKTMEKFLKSQKEKETKRNAVIGYVQVANTKELDEIMELILKLNDLNTQGNNPIQKENKIVSKCCKAEVDYAGGGYDGEDLVEITRYCKKCFSSCDVIYARRGRPYKIELPF